MVVGSSVQGGLQQELCTEHPQRTHSGAPENCSDLSATTVPWLVLPYLRSVGGDTLSLCCILQRLCSDSYHCAFCCPVYKVILQWGGCRGINHQILTAGATEAQGGEWHHPGSFSKLVRETGIGMKTSKQSCSPPSVEHGTVLYWIMRNDASFFL